MLQNVLDHVHQDVLQIVQPLLSTLPSLRLYACDEHAELLDLTLSTLPAWTLSSAQLGAQAELRLAYHHH